MILDQWKIDNLGQLNRTLQARVGEYAYELGGQEQEQGDHATCQAKIKTSKQGEKQVEFDLEQDPNTREWKISSLEPLQSVGQ